MGDGLKERLRSGSVDELRRACMTAAAARSAEAGLVQKELLESADARDVAVGVTIGLYRDSMRGSSLLAKAMASSPGAAGQIARVVGDIVLTDPEFEMGFLGELVDESDLLLAWLDVFGLARVIGPAAFPSGRVIAGHFLFDIETDIRLAAAQAMGRLALSEERERSSLLAGLLSSKGHGSPGGHSSAPQFRHMVAVACALIAGGARPEPGEDWPQWLMDVLKEGDLRLLPLNTDDDPDRGAALLSAGMMVQSELHQDLVLDYVLELTSQSVTAASMLWSGEALTAILARSTRLGLSVDARLFSAAEALLAELLSRPAAELGANLERLKLLKRLLRPIVEFSCDDVPQHAIWGKKRLREFWHNSGPFGPELRGMVAAVAGGFLRETMRPVARGREEDLVSLLRTPVDSASSLAQEYVDFCSGPESPEAEGQELADLRFRELLCASLRPISDEVAWRVSTEVEKTRSCWRLLELASLSPRKDGRYPLWCLQYGGIDVRCSPEGLENLDPLETLSAELLERIDEFDGHLPQHLVDYSLPRTRGSYELTLLEIDDHLDRSRMPALAGELESYFSRRMMIAERYELLKDLFPLLARRPPRLLFKRLAAKAEVRNGVVAEVARLLESFDISKLAPEEALVAYRPLIAGLLAWEDRARACGLPDCEEDRELKKGLTLVGEQLATIVSLQAGNHSEFFKALKDFVAPDKLEHLAARIDAPEGGKDMKGPVGSSAWFLAWLHRSSIELSPQARRSIVAEMRGLTGALDDWARSLRTLRCGEQARLPDVAAGLRRLVGVVGRVRQGLVRLLSYPEGFLLERVLDAYQRRLELLAGEVDETRRLFDAAVAMGTPGLSMAEAILAACGKIEDEHLCRGDEKGLSLCENLVVMSLEQAMRRGDEQHVSSLRSLCSEYLKRKRLAHLARRLYYWHLDRFDVSSAMQLRGDFDLPHVRWWPVHYRPMYLGVIAGAIMTPDASMAWHDLVAHGNWLGVLLIILGAIAATLSILAYAVESTLSVPPAQRVGYRIRRLLPRVGRVFLVCLAFSLTVNAVLLSVLGSSTLVSSVPAGVAGRFFQLMLWSSMTLFVGIVVGVVVQGRRVTETPADLSR